MWKKGGVSKIFKSLVMALAIPLVHEDASQHSPNPSILALLLAVFDPDVIRVESEVEEAAVVAGLLCLYCSASYFHGTVRPSP